jgi:hypothetical protein
MLPPLSIGAIVSTVTKALVVIARVIVYKFPLFSVVTVTLLFSPDSLFHDSLSRTYAALTQVVYK